MTAKVKAILAEVDSMRVAEAASMLPTVQVTSSVPLTFVATLVPLHALQDSAVEFAHTDAVECAHTETSESERNMGFASDAVD